MTTPEESTGPPSAAGGRPSSASTGSPPASPGSPAAAPRLTEARNPRTLHIDRASPTEVVDTILAEDRAVLPAVQAESAAIAELVARVHARLEEGGRLFYVGAGTSGRLGVLDASECPPTFGTDPELVQGLIAGGREALTRSREGVEDDREAGRGAIGDAGVGPSDFVLGIAASGVTPYVLAAMQEARDRGAGVGFLTCSEPPPEARAVAEVLVTPRVGPEVIAGSTRMKAGTATKLVLNTLSTGVMIRRGKVYQNLMVDLQAVSAKLVDRSLRIVQEVAGVDRERARDLLLSAGGRAKTAIAMARLGSDRATADRLLDACDGFLGRALERFEGAAPLPGWTAYPPEATDARRERILRRLERGPTLLERALERSVRPESETGETLARLIGFESSTVPAVLVRLKGAQLEGAAGTEGSAAGCPPAPAEAETGVATPRGRDGIPRSSEEPGPRRPGGRRSSEGPDALVRRFTEAREQTLRWARALPPEGWLVTADVEGEEVRAVQFLAGVAGVTAAAVDRLEDRIHPDLTPGPA